MRPGSLHSRIAALALALLLAWPVLVLAQFLGGQVALDRARIARAEAVLDKDSALGRRMAVDSRATARAQAFVHSLAWTLDRSSPELLSAQLQRLVESMAARDSAVVASFRTVAPTTEQGLARVGLELDIEASLPALQKLLHDMEASRPGIFVDRLSVQVPESGSLSQGSDGQDRLSVALRLAVYGVGARTL
jgi:hypothetical protein